MVSGSKVSVSNAEALTLKVTEPPVQACCGATGVSIDKATAVVTAAVVACGLPATVGTP